MTAGPKKASLAFTKPRFVKLTTETFERIQRSADLRIARRTANISNDEGPALVAEMERMLQEDDKGACLRCLALSLSFVMVGGFG